MTARVIITPAAEADLAEARDWYAAIRPELSGDFEMALNAALDPISYYPESHSLMQRGLRRALLHRFSHAVFYRTQADGSVHIIAVLHTSRNPHIWHARTH